MGLNYSFSQEVEYIEDTLTFYYDTDIYVLSASQKTELKNYLKNKTLHKITVEGYADYVGAFSYNKMLALKRANYLLNAVLEIQPIDSVHVLSKGEMSKPENSNKLIGNSADRKSITYFTYSKSILGINPKVSNGLKTLNTPGTYLEAIPKMQVGESIVLRTILFYLGEAIIIPSSFSDMKIIKETLVNNPNMVVEIRGHVCCGVKYEATSEYPEPKQSDYNMTLSYNRAAAIKNYLVDGSINADRVSIKGMGFLEPLYYPERNEAQRQLNRRIELIVLKK